MKQLVIPVLLVFSMSAFAQTTKTTITKKKPVNSSIVKPIEIKITDSVVMKNLLDSFSYAAGHNVAMNMKEQGIAALNLVIMQKAMDDVFQKKTPQLNPEQVSSSLQKQLKEFADKKAAAVVEASRKFLEENKKRPGVVTTASGLQYEVLKSAAKQGPKPRQIDTVVVNYIGTLIDGTEFNNSYKDKRPATFQLTGVIKGWTEVLQLMSVGDKWKVFIPTELAYGMYPRDPKVIPPGSALIFEIALEEIKLASAKPAPGLNNGQNN